MEIQTGKYYHIYNRSNNREIVFKEDDNYDFFIEKYKKYISPFVDTVAFCLMPTHFHFCLAISSHDVNTLKDNFGTLLSSYTKAINKRNKRNGSLFQKHTKAIEIDDESYLVTLCMYIHQNPLRANLVSKQEDWKYSSFHDYISVKQSGVVKTDVLMQYFRAPDDFKKYSEDLIQTINTKYWIR